MPQCSLPHLSNTRRLSHLIRVVAFYHSNWYLSGREGRGLSYVDNNINAILFLIKFLLFSWLVAWPSTWELARLIYFFYVAPWTIGNFIIADSHWNSLEIREREKTDKKSIKISFMTTSSIQLTFQFHNNVRTAAGWKWQKRSRQNSESSSAGEKMVTVLRWSSSSRGNSILHSRDTGNVIESLSSRVTSMI